MRFIHASLFLCRQTGFGAAAALLLVICPTITKADAVRVQVATLDKEPVYHWCVFKSVLPDDVDRALVLREFRRKKYELPQSVLDAAIKNAITELAGGNRKEFERKLRQKGTSLSEFRRFTAEEIRLSAMLYQNARDEANRAELQARWLAGLRSGAVIKRTLGPSQNRDADGDKTPAKASSSNFIPRPTPRA